MIRSASEAGQASDACADMVELADTPDLGSGGLSVQVRVLLSAPDNDNPNPVPIGDGFGFLVYLEC